MIRATHASARDRVFPANRYIIISRRCDHGGMRDVMPRYYGIDNATV